MATGFAADPSQQIARMSGEDLCSLTEGAGDRRARIGTWSSRTSSPTGWPSSTVTTWLRRAAVAHLAKGPAPPPLPVRSRIRQAPEVDERPVTRYSSEGGVRRQRAMLLIASMPTAGVTRTDQSIGFRSSDADRAVTRAASTGSDDLCGRRRHTLLRTAAARPGEGSSAHTSTISCGPHSVCRTDSSPVRGSGTAATERLSNRFEAAAGGELAQPARRSVRALSKRMNISEPRTCASPLIGIQSRRTSARRSGISVHIRGRHGDDVVGEVERNLCGAGLGRLNARPRLA